MSLWSILLRVLLSLFLILNGVATAAAATHMQAGDVDLQAVVAMPAKASQVVAEEMPCHQHHQAQSTPAQDEPSAAIAPAPAKAKHPSPDCCKSGACSCTCMQGAQAALPGLTFAAPVLDHSRCVRRLTMAHAAPALSHLIRPPIT
jgi:hypothetical protein